MIPSAQLRPCIPEDVAIAIPLILSSGPTSFSYVFDTERATATGFLRYAFQRTGGEFSYDNHYALLVDDHMIGIGSVFDGQKASSFTLTDLKNIVRFYKYGCLPVLGRGLRIERIIRLPKKHEICLAHLAIEKNFQGRGFGQRLIELLMKEKKASPSSYYILDVSEENLRAKSLYDRLGFSTSRHSISKLKSNYGYVANHYRMELR